ncbi:hypothetical protein NDU88_000876 [Pleurodeles waltl]|uniref:Uncharacterized protein n=1 Tax=Pleurodeles waltl TaxID=8319 RepID=A0AAV7UR68_PLEWA|nr:hypothetical protein NDU88_000876 [Pleurodeles waltl]
MARREIRVPRPHRNSIYVAEECTILYGADPVWALGARKGALRPMFQARVDPQAAATTLFPGCAPRLPGAALAGHRLNGYY